MLALCTLDELSRHTTLGIYAQGSAYLLVASDDGVKAYLNNCPHLGIPLEWQEHQFIDADSGLLRCASHGALFLPTTGECVSGPCAGSALTAIPVHIEQDTVWVDDSSRLNQPACD